MSTRPIVLTVAGFDPSGGAGILADIKTIEQHQAMGLAVTTCITYQTDNQFFGMDWLSVEHVINQLRPLLTEYKIAAIKIGLIQLDQIQAVIESIPSEIPLVWDPILSASAGFEFKNDLNHTSIEKLMSQVDLITPNLEEYDKLGLEGKTITNVLLKGGHQQDHKNDELILKDGSSIIVEGEVFEKSYQKHGTGCILSSAIASNLALGKTLEESCTSAKKYVEQVLKSNDGLLGYHSL